MSALYASQARRALKAPPRSHLLVSSHLYPDSASSTSSPHGALTMSSRASQTPAPDGSFSRAFRVPSATPAPYIKPDPDAAARVPRGASAAPIFQRSASVRPYQSRASSIGPLRARAGTVDFVARPRSSASRSAPND